jgi:hypothetical protein
MLSQRPVAVAAHFLGEVAIVIPAYFLYFLVRGFVEGQEADALRRADNLIQLERALGIFWEVDIQDWVLGSNLLINLANWTYIWGHWPVIGGIALWLFAFHRPNYPLYRNAFVISGAIGLVIFTLLPTAPPRMMDAWGFVDTVTERSEAYRTFQPPAFVNQYAAMPSLHFGWNLLLSVAVVRHAAAWPLKLFGVVMPAMSFWAIVATANHFILDGVFGAVVALAGLGIAFWLSRNLAPWRPARSGRHG